MIHGSMVSFPAKHHHCLWPVLISHPAEGRRLSWLDGWLHTLIVYLQMVTHLSISKSWHRVVWLIVWTMPLPLGQAVTTDYCAVHEFVYVVLHTVNVLVSIVIQKSTLESIINVVFAVVMLLQPSHGRIATLETSCKLPGGVWAIDHGRCQKVGVKQHAQPR